MLKAVNDNGDFCVLYAMKYSEVPKIRAGIWYCPECMEVVSPVYGSIVMPHFRHKRDTKCPYGKGMSQGHYLLESYLHKMLSVDPPTNLAIPHGSIVEIERPLKSGTVNRRADVAVIHNGHVIQAHEVQLSPIGTNELEERTEDYMSLGIIPVWYFGEKSFRQDLANYLIDSVGVYAKTDVKKKIVISMISG